MIKINRLVLIAQIYGTKTNKGILCVCVCMYIYIYIYICGERERERERTCCKSMFMKLLFKQAYTSILSNTEKSVLSNQFWDCFCVSLLSRWWQVQVFLYIEPAVSQLDKLVSVVSGGLFEWIPQVDSSGEHYYCSCVFWYKYPVRFFW